jgi:deoxynucleoside triphosphate triphosphohydrolase SAMHD1
MVVDALLAADAYLKVSEQIDDPDRYVLLTDSILEEIERSVNFVSNTVPTICAVQHFTQELEASRQIINRLRRRQLYKCVDIVHIPEKEESRFRSVVTPMNIAHEANIIRLGSPETSQLQAVEASDVIVDFNFLHFGMKNQNPIELV